jgi:hypothetical protein
MLNRRGRSRSSATWLSRSLRPTSLAALLLAVLALSSGNTLVTATAPPVSAESLQRFLSHVEPPVTHYRAKRTLRARNERFNKEGSLTAWTELDPASGFRYEIIAEEGSGYIRNKVLRKTLEGEREAIASGDPSRSALSPANYQFTPDAAAADGPFATLRIVPLRKDRLLVDGRITVTTTDGDLIKIEGRLSKNPSWWTNHVDIVRRYGRVDGIRVPLGVESTASVKIAGTSTFSMTYEYESINGKRVAAPTTSSSH